MLEYVEIHFTARLFFDTIGFSLQVNISRCLDGDYLRALFSADLQAYSFGQSRTLFRLRVQFGLQERDFRLNCVSDREFSQSEVSC